MPIFDTIFAVLRRGIKQKSLKAIFNADRGHLHHKLIDKGYTQKQAVFILYIISVAMGLFTIILIQDGIWKALSLALIIIVITTIGKKDLLREKNK